jgi:hypothetical protein
MCCGISFKRAFKDNSVLIRKSKEAVRACVERMSTKNHIQVAILALATQETLFSLEQRPSVSTNVLAKECLSLKNNRQILLLNHVHFLLFIYIYIQTKYLNIKLTKTASRFRAYRGHSNPSVFLNIFMWMMSNWW